MSNYFKQNIQEYLDKYSDENPAFKEFFINPKKSIDECLQHIISEVKTTNREGFDDEEIYEMARNYYTKSDIVIDKELKANVVINKAVKVEIKKEADSKTKLEDKNQLNLF